MHQSSMFLQGREGYTGYLWEFLKELPSGWNNSFKRTCTSFSERCGPGTGLQLIKIQSDCLGLQGSCLSSTPGPGGNSSWGFCLLFSRAGHLHTFALDFLLPGISSPQASSTFLPRKPLFILQDPTKLASSVEPSPYSHPCFILDSLEPSPMPRMQ